MYSNNWWLGLNVEQLSNSWLIKFVETRLPEALTQPLFLFLIVLVAFFFSWFSV
jgi:hypothetical protein